MNARPKTYEELEESSLEKSAKDLTEEQLFPGWVRDETTKDYFLNEWGRIDHTNEALFEHLCLMTFQLGLWWKTVLGKREALRELFCKYNVEKVAALSDDDLLEATHNPQLIRNIYKLQACRNNARVLKNYKIGLVELFDRHFSEVLQIDSVEELPKTHPITDEITAELRVIGLRYIGSVSVCAVAQAAGYIRLKPST